MQKNKVISQNLTDLSYRSGFNRFSYMLQKLQVPEFTDYIVGYHYFRVCKNVSAVNMAKKMSARQSKS